MPAGGSPGGLINLIDGMSNLQHTTLDELVLRARQMTSFVSYPDRCSLWGDGRYRGNCDGRLFLGLTLRYQPRSVADPMMGSGTTRDVIQWLNQEHGTQIAYWGGDLRSGFNLQRDQLPGKFDFIWVHPPYWNIIQYSEDSADLSTCADYDDFRERLRRCLARCHAALNADGHLAVLVGDVRKRGQYFPIVRDLLCWDGELGQVCSVLIKAQHHCQSDNRTYTGLTDARIQHEYCVVFRKTAERTVSASKRL